MGLKLHAQAEAALRKAVQSKPDNAAYQHSLGLALFSQASPLSCRTCAVSMAAAYITERLCDLVQHILHALESQLWEAMSAIGRCLSSA